VFAAVTFAAIPVERYGGRHVGPCGTIFTPHGTGFACLSYSTAAFVYWPIALVLAYVAIAAFYLRQSQRRGLGTRVGPYIVAGIILSVLVTVAAAAPGHPRRRTATRCRRIRLGTAASPASGRVTGHPASGLDDVVHQRVRLGILAIAQEARRIDFCFLRSNLEVTAGNLSQHLGVLESAGLITIEKGYEGKRARTWIALTRAGRAALTEEITQLKRLISQLDRADKTQG